MKITNEQIKRMNAKLHNGFRLDVARCMVWSEKTAVKTVPLPDGRVIKAEIAYQEVYRQQEQFWKRELLGVRPSLSLTLWRQSDTGMWISHGMGADVEITEALYQKRLWNELAQYTAEWTDEKILEAAREHMSELRNEYIVA